MFVRSVGSVSKTGPVCSGLRSRIGLALISVPIGPTIVFSSTRKFRRRGNFGKKVRAVAIDLVQKSSNFELFSRFFGRLKILQDLEGHDETSEVPIWRSCEFPVLRTYRRPSLDLWLEVCKYTLIKWWLTQQLHMCFLSDACCPSAGVQAQNQFLLLLVVVCLGVRLHHEIWYEFWT